MSVKRIKRVPVHHRLVRVSLVVFLVYATICAGMMFLETAMIFPAPRFPSGDWNADRVAAREVTFASSDGVELVGWYLERENASNVAVYFHGNGEHIAYVAEYIDQYQQALDATMFLFDYRGYGKSGGRPNEPGVLADSVAAVDWVCRETGRKPDQIVLVGRSLGGACAVHVAAQKGARAVILHSTFCSMVDVAAVHYPWLPIRLLMRNQFRLMDKIKAYHGPLFQTHGRNDMIVPVRFGRRLFDASPAKNKQFYEIVDGGHNDLEPPECWQAMTRFIGDLNSADQP